ncbi:MAG: aminoacyl-tRNA hydrolase [Actinobacteria bacterium]|nr:aminoacyl-tRNA hydrolase [Actinomycetota bacterium]
MNRLRLIAALGNPGARYRTHRHSVGFMVAEELTRRHGWGPLRNRFSGLTAEGRLEGVPVMLLLPQTYMNLSGNSVAKAARFHKIAVDDIIAIHDEVELPFGTIRLKQGGGLGGHNGLRSLEKALGSREFWRVRVGVGRPPHPAMDLADFVLSPFTEPSNLVEAAVNGAADLTEQWIMDLAGDGVSLSINGSPSSATSNPSS